MLDPDDDIDLDISEALGDILGLFGCNIVDGLFFFYRDRWSSLMHQLTDFRKFGVPPSYYQTVKKMNLLFTIAMAYTVPSIILYCFVSYLTIGECEEVNARTGLNQHCALLNPTWLPIGELRGYSKILFYVLQLLGNHPDYSGSSRNTSLPSTSPKSLAEKLRDLVTNTTGPLYLVAALIIGALGSQAIKESIPKALLYCTGYMAGVFLLCHAGQKLINETESLADSVYNSNWYEKDAKLMRNLILIIKRSQKPLKFHAIPSGEYSYMAYTILVKTAYSYITLLNRVV
ncbi:uncharacterized protein LOC115882837 [Sitophilus oryzae]|uniref:Uncharacterized protein LOC115882837 n=1 Tax=Sitophilus oryzae TaxID=7048 RepID=A0A6J2Y0W8_SITOR|nr:uncharacterized protein LOC115882837 [Sitophilus oryzae]